VIGPAANNPEYEARIREGDRLRDSRQYAAAAAAYAAALVIMPQRTDIRVQYGNMLKDSGRAAEAAAAYRQALAENPDDPDIHLQLGRALKLQGKRNEAIAAYRRSAGLRPDNIEALKELFFAGSFDDQQQLFERRLAAGGVEAIMALGEEIARLQATLRRLAEKLPALQAQTAVPLAGYDRFRRLYDVPPAPPPLRPCRFAVILPTCGAALDTVYAQFAAMRAQTIADWRLCVVADDSSIGRIVEPVAASDPRIAWSEAASGEDLVATECRVALSLDADWLVLLGEGALLHRRALEWFAAVAARGPATAYVTDAETVASEGEITHRSSPVLRQVVDFDTLLEANPFGETIAIERAAYTALAEGLVTGSIAGARASLLLRLAECRHVGHIPLPLVAGNGGFAAAGSPPGAHESVVRAYIASAGDRCPIAFETPASPGAPLVIRWQPRDPAATLLVIIPTRDNSVDLGHFVESLRSHAEQREAMRLLIVDNGSRDAATLRILGALSEQPWAGVLNIDEPFNWARLNNRAVAASDAPLLVFANDDMAMLSPDWDRHLRGLLDRPEIGAVGARLVYPDDTIQHAGILLGWEGIDAHDGRYEVLTDPGPGQRWHVSRAVSAVTGAFLALRREAFAAVGGFDEAALPVAYSDIDLCLKLRARGLKILWTPRITLRHFESKSRRLDHLDPESAARYAAERRHIVERWGSAMQSDPSLNPLWHQATLPFRLLSMPSEARLWRHIRLCASPNPWLPDSGDGEGDNTPSASSEFRSS
jgi:GT2 family glycosyltransferase/tetratricopeptide (TPR) repeat protein